MSSLPLVCFPGGSGDAAVFARFAAQWGTSSPLVCVDYPGLGSTPARPDVQSLDELYRFAVSSLPARCDLLAVSMGGVLALRAALEFPQRIRRLVLLVTSGGVDVGALGALNWREGWVGRRPSAPRWFVDDRTDLTARLSEIAAPTLLVFSDSDPISPPAVGRFLQERIPEARLEIIPGAPHDLVATHAEKVAALVREHLGD